MFFPIFMVWSTQAEKESVSLAMEIKCRENAVDSCRSILRMIREYRSTDKAHPLNSAIREALLEDLCEKCKHVSTSERAAFLSEGLYYSSPDRIRDLFKEDAFDSTKLAALPSHTKLSANIGFVTVIRAELQALLAALGNLPMIRTISVMDHIDIGLGEFLYPHVMIYHMY